MCVISFFTYIIYLVPALRAGLIEMTIPDKPLLIVSGVAQIGFLVYFISTWAGEQSYNAEFSVIFFQTGLVIRCGIGLSNDLKLL